MLGDITKTSLSEAEFTRAMQTIESYKTINSLMTGSAEAVVVKHSLYIHFPALGAFDFSLSGKFHGYNAPDEVIQYFDNLDRYKGDPIISHVLSTGKPVWLSDTLTAGFLEDTGHETTIQQTIKYIGDGLCCPLFGPDNRTGYAFVGFGRSKSEFDPIMSFQIHCLLQTMHIQYCMLMRGLQREVKLTPREAEVLEFISYGKSNPEIGDILGISSRTVAVHVSNIFTKLGTSDRVNAALRMQTIPLIT